MASQISDEVQHVMNNVVAESLVEKYTNGIIKLFLWIFDNEELRNSLFKPWFIVDLENSHSTDQSLTNARKRGTRKYIRSEMKNCISRIKRNDPNTHPFLFVFFNFDIFSRYLTSRKKTITVRRTADGEILNSNSEEAVLPENVEEEVVDVYFGKSSYDSIRSSVMHLYCICNVEMDDELQKNLSTYIAGMKRVVAKEKKATGQKLTEGIRDMPLAVYEKICKIFLKEENDEYTFAHAFFTIEWNLMARADNVVDISVEHIEWLGDSLIFHFATTKTDQSGEKQRIPWHVYSNPMKPHICPVLAFSKYVLTHPGVL